MIKLSNVSKYYHNEGIVTLALHKINLEFELGEFVAITGESGSGKSTLLNVIAGIDTYEEGELYINGEETSYFDDDDWEGYRKNKIAFVFQNYNLIDSYTVLKNVEVSLVIQGLTKKERIQRAKDIIEKVGLTDHLKHKASKLSGGQKQRLAIARALAKETDIIVADEPTGNLDSVSGKQVIELLNEISKEKLVFIVTHNYEQVANFVSRKIRLFDGEVVEDKQIRNVEVDKKIEEVKPATTEANQALTIAKFNLFNQPKKTIFMFLVCFAVVFFIFLFYSYMITAPINSERYQELNNYQERLIVTRKDKNQMTGADYDFLKSDRRVDKVIKEDNLIDRYMQFSYEYGDYYYYFRGQIQFNLQTTSNSLIGRLPEAEDEILLNFYYNDFEADNIKNLLNKEVDFYMDRDFYDGENTISFKVVGINKRSNQAKDGYVITDSAITRLYEFNRYGTIKNSFVVYAEDDTFIHNDMITIKLDNTLTGNQAILESTYIPDNYSYIKVMNKRLEIKEIRNNPNTYNIIYLSQEFYNENFSFSQKQYTVNLKNINDRVALEKHLYNNGYYALSPYYDISSTDFYDTFNAIASLFSSLGFVLIMLVIYLISYLVFKLIMNTKIKDYTILRIIGARKTLISNVIRIELLISFLVAYIIFFLAYIFIRDSLPFLKNFKTTDFIIIFLINIFISLLIARRFIKKQVQKSLYTNLRSE